MFAAGMSATPILSAALAFVALLLLLRWLSYCCLYLLL
jgi:hypothetical protein